MKIVDIRPTTVTVPLEAPLRHANGCHWGRFVRTIVEVETDNGLIGLGEMGGGGESAEAEADQTVVCFHFDNGAYETAPVAAICVPQGRLEGNRDGGGSDVYDLHDLIRRDNRSEE